MTRLSADELVLVAMLKQMVKDDAGSLRAEKRAVRDLQRRLAADAAAAQHRLAVHRLDARARLLVYGLVRGRAWECIEANHGPLTYQLVRAIERAWKLSQEVTAARNGGLVPMPAAVEALLPAAWRAVR